MIKEDVIEGVIALPPKLFYGSGIPNAKVYVASEMESLEHQIVFL
jgi:type I restriction-modification system DNA methylase subunit